MQSAALVATRRTILGAATAALVTGSAAAIPTNDAELIALADRYTRLDAEITRLDRSGAPIDGKMTEWRALVEQISTIKANTTAGLRAKADLALAVMNDAGDPGPGNAPVEQRFMRSLCADILRQA